MKSFSVIKIQKQSLAILKKFTSDKRLLFDLTIQNVISEIDDIYFSLSHSIDPNIVLRTKKVVITVYCMYLDALLRGQSKGIGEDLLELFLSLINAAVYHLVGQSQGYAEEECGAKSYEFYLTRWQADDALCFLLVNSSLDDSIAQENLVAIQCPESLRSNIWVAYCILKDAIILSQCEDDEDFQFSCTMFRLPTSEAYIELVKSMRSI